VRPVRVACIRRRLLLGSHSTLAEARLTHILISPDWLEARLDAEDLLIVDARTNLPVDGEWHVDESRREYQAAHIPGAIFVDLVNDLNDSTGLPVTRPRDEMFRIAAGRSGLDPARHIVIYDYGERDGHPAASIFGARLWYQLSSHGFPRVSVLDGGWYAWQAEGRPTQSGTEMAPAVALNSSEAPGWFTDLGETLAAVADDSATLLDSRERDRYLGTSPMPYRQGHLPTAVHLANADTLAGDTGYLKAADELRKVFGEIVPSEQRVITYCGVGLSAAWNAFAIRVAGWSDVAVYDGSIMEWANTDHPLIVGDETAG